MKVTLELLGIHMGPFRDGDEVEVAPATTIDALMAKHGTPRVERELVLCLVNGRLERPTYVLAPGDRLKLFVPRAGG